MKKIFILFFLFIPIFLPINTLANFNYTWSTLDLTLETSNNITSKNIDDNSNTLNLDCRFLHFA